MIQFTDHMKLKKKEDQSVNASVLLRRGNKIIIGGRGRKEFGRKRRGEGEREGKNQIWEEMEEMYRGMEIEQRCVAMRNWE